MFGQTVLRWLMTVAIAACFLGTALFGQEELRKVKTKVEPTYPELAKTMHLSGIVRVEIKISPDGTIKSSKVLGGHPVLAQAALVALQKWKYEPANEETTMIVPFKFRQ